jgi:hypothetical protein
MKKQVMLKQTVNSVLRNRRADSFGFSLLVSCMVTNIEIDYSMLPIIIESCTGLFSIFSSQIKQKTTHEYASKV